MSAVKTKVVSVRLIEEEQRVVEREGGSPGKGLYAHFIRQVIHQHWSTGEPIPIAWVRLGVHEVQSDDHGPFVPWEDGWGVVRWLVKNRERLMREVAMREVAMGGAPQPPPAAPRREQLRLPIEGGCVLPPPATGGDQPV